MVFIQEYKDNENNNIEWILGDVGELLEQLQDNDAPKSFKRLRDAISCLRDNGNRADVEVRYNNGAIKYCNFLGVTINNDNETNGSTKENILEEIKEPKYDGIKDYFHYQKKINNLKEEIKRLDEQKNRLNDNITTDITTIFLAYDFNDMDFEVDLTGNGLKINYYAQKYNDYRLNIPINTELFNQLNNLIGVTGKLNICGEKVNRGVSSVIIELDYEL